MKRKQLIRKILAWVSVTVILLSGIGCSKAPQVDISEKTNTERLEEAAVMTLRLEEAAVMTFSTTAATQLVAEDKPTLTEAEVVNDTAIIPYSPLYDLLGASTHYDVELMANGPASQINANFRQNLTAALGITSLLHPDDLEAAIAAAVAADDSVSDEMWQGVQEMIFGDYCMLKSLITNYTVTVVSPKLHDANISIDGAATSTLWKAWLEK